LSNNPFSQNAISHKELNDFLIKAKKDNYSTNTAENTEFQKTEEFNDLIKTWTQTSQKILLMLNNEEKVLTDNKNPKSLMALGAMGAHIKMALQAHKATESDM
tara:strand:+ start:363 stop:671 length:309 start_codon:yes stop_codon:yes gene_type:complete